MGELGSIWFLALVFGSKLGRNSHLEIWMVLELHIVAPFFRPKWKWRYFSSLFAMWLAILQTFGGIFWVKWSTASIFEATSGHFYPKGLLKNAGRNWSLGFIGVHSRHISTCLIYIFFFSIFSCILLGSKVAVLTNPIISANCQEIFQSG